MPLWLITGSESGPFLIGALAILSLPTKTDNAVEAVENQRRAIRIVH